MNPRTASEVVGGADLDRPTIRRTLSDHDGAADSLSSGVVERRVSTAKWRAIT